MIIESNDTVSYFSDFRVHIHENDLKPRPGADVRTIPALVTSLNSNVDDYREEIASQIRSQLTQPSVETFSEPVERQLLQQIAADQTPMVGVALHFSEGSLIVVGTITITLVLGNPALKSLLLSVGNQLLSKVAVFGVQRVLQRARSTD